MFLTEKIHLSDNKKIHGAVICRTRKHSASPPSVWLSRSRLTAVAGPHLLPPCAAASALQNARDRVGRLLVLIGPLADCRCPALPSSGALAQVATTHPLLTPYSDLAPRLASENDNGREGFLRIFFTARPILTFLADSAKYACNCQICGKFYQMQYKIAYVTKTYNYWYTLSTLIFNLKFLVYTYRSIDVTDHTYSPISHTLTLFLFVLYFSSFMLWLFFIFSSASSRKA